MNLSPLWISLKTATISTLIVFVIGIVLARIFSKKDFFGKTALESLLLLPMVLPPTVVGFGLLYLFGKNSLLGRFLGEYFGLQIVFTWYGVILAALVVSFPLMYQSAKAAFQRFDSNLEHAAYTMGASRFRVFWTISFPLAWPGLLAGVILSFARALGEFGATLMVAGYIPGVTETIPLAIYFAVESGEMKAAGLWVLMISLIGFIALFWLNVWNRRMNNRSVI
mgnify:CR=1 FL=1